MVWHKLLLILALAVPTLLGAGLGGGCASASELTTGCINGGGVDVIATSGGPGSPGGSGSGASGGSAASGPPVIWKCLQVTCGSESPGAAPITLSDIASFRPNPGVQYMQPDGWTVPGLDTNFYAVTDVHVVDGTLLGQPASVRFTPVGFHWTYGDGKAANLPTKGATWQTLGVGEFDSTPTSHIYANEGEYTIRLVIDFAPAYRFAGSPFYPIAGVIPLPANDLHITVDGAKTVLVEHDCAVNPTGPGC
ncbi:MAG: hypothetical protein ABI566_07055 [Pseudolysinimonas sp.]